MTNSNVAVKILEKPLIQRSVWIILFSFATLACSLFVLDFREFEGVFVFFTHKQIKSIIVLELLFFVALSFLFLGYPTKDLTIFLLGIFIRDRRKIYLREVRINADESDLVRLDTHQGNSRIAKTLIIYPVLILSYIVILIFYSNHQ